MVEIYICAQVMLVIPLQSNIYTYVRSYPRTYVILYFCVNVQKSNIHSKLYFIHCMVNIKMPWLKSTSTCLLGSALAHLVVKFHVGFTFMTSSVLLLLLLQKYRVIFLYMYLISLVLHSGILYCIPIVGIYCRKKLLDLLSAKYLRLLNWYTKSK